MIIAESSASDRVVLGARAGPMTLSPPARLDGRAARQGTTAVKTLAECAAGPRRREAVWAYTLDRLASARGQGKWAVER